jgi:hypothetical protein
MIRIEDYILLPLEQRKKHLRLDEQCVERGGNSALVSYAMRGTLSYILNTSLPYKINVEACHACNNGKCSNPFHLYWGTRKENTADYICSSNYKSLWQKMVEKHGLEKAKEIQASSGRKNISSINQQRLNNKEEQNKVRAKEALTDARKIAERNSQFGTCWIRKEGKEIKIKQNKILLFISEGWEKGRTTKLFVRT